MHYVSVHEISIYESENFVYDVLYSKNIAHTHTKKLTVMFFYYFTLHFICFICFCYIALYFIITHCY